MNRYAIFIILLFISAACSKNRVSPSGLIGKWELRKSVGGFAGTINYPPGSAGYVKFEASAYTVTTANGDTRSGNYVLKPVPFTDNFYLEWHYVLNGQPQISSDSVHFSADELVFFARVSCCDVPTNFYARTQ